MAKKPIRCSLGFHGKIAWDSEKIRDIARETRFGREYKEYLIGTCIECGQRVLEETMKSVRGIIESMPPGESRLVSDPTIEQESVHNEMLEAQAAALERKELMAALNRASNMHPDLRLGELMFLALTRRIRGGLDHGADKDGKVGHALYYVLDSELKKAIETIPRAAQLREEKQTTPF